VSFAHLHQTDKWIIIYAQKCSHAQKENLYYHSHMTNWACQIIELFRRCKISSGICLNGFSQKDLHRIFLQKTNAAAKFKQKSVKSRCYTGAIRRILETAKHSAPQHATLTANQQNSTATQLRLVHRKYTRENIRIMLWNFPLKP